MLKCPFLSHLESLNLCFFCLPSPHFLPRLYLSGTGIVSGPRFHQTHNPQADTKFTRTTTTSERADPAKKHLGIDGAC